jgi:hypothetical protein
MTTVGCDFRGNRKGDNFHFSSFLIRSSLVASASNCPLRTCSGGVGCVKTPGNFSNHRCRTSMTPFFTSNGSLVA